MSTITVSNGHEFVQIDSADLPAAIQDGFYRPFDRGQTIVGNGQMLFEIPIADVDSAKADGLRDVLAGERKEWNRNAKTNANGKTNSALKPRPSDDQGLITGLSQSEQEEEARLQQAQQELAGASGWNWLVLRCRMTWETRRVGLLRQIRGNGISAVVHVAVILILASLILKVDEEPKGIVFDASPAADDMVEEVVIEPTPLEITEPTETVEPDAPTETEVVKAEVVAVPDFMGAVRGDAVKPPARMSTGGTGNGRAMKKASFFGKRVSAVEYVFVIDNSNSMTGGRFETALNELLIAVNQLTPRQRFYVIFYSDTAYPMFHPKPATQLLPATPRNKAALRAWLDTVQLCLRTDGREAIEAAFALQPDVIFVLGDGGFTDKAAQFFAARPQKKIPLHSLGMEVKPKDAEAFQLLAESNGGTYKDVGVASGARELAKRNPRPRNSSRGPVWGIKLKPRPNAK